MVSRFRTYKLTTQRNHVRTEIEGWEEALANLGDPCVVGGGPAARDFYEKMADNAKQAIEKLDFLIDAQKELNKSLQFVLRAWKNAELPLSKMKLFVFSLEEVSDVLETIRERENVAFTFEGCINRKHCTPGYSVTIYTFNDALAVELKMLYSNIEVE